MIVSSIAQQLCLLTSKDILASKSSCQMMDSSFPRAEVSRWILPTANSGTLHQKRRGWVKLSLDILVTNFPSIIAFAKRVMEVVPPNLVSVKVLYHEANERVDFLFQDKGRNPSFGVLVAFEPGYPEVALLSIVDCLFPLPL